MATIFSKIDLAIFDGSDGSPAGTVGLSGVDDGFVPCVTGERISLLPESTCSVELPPADPFGEFESAAMVENGS